MGGSIDMPKNVGSDISSALKRAGEAFLDDVIAGAPRRTGKMADSATAELVDDDTIRVGFGVPYAVFQEQKTIYEHDDGKAGFFASAAESIGPKVEQIVADELRRKLGG